MPSWPPSACNRSGKLVYSYFLVRYGVTGNQFYVVHNIKKKEGHRERGLRPAVISLLDLFSRKEL